MEMMSTDISKLAEALSKAQGIMRGAKEDSSNPFFKSSYADLTSVWEACRSALSEHGLSISQLVDNSSERLSLTTMLLHSSGQWIRSCMPLLPKQMDVQAVGSAITYARRYALAAIVGVCPSDGDDDGESAMSRDKPQHKPQPVQKKEIITKQQFSQVMEQIGGDQAYINRLTEFYKKKGQCESGLNDLHADALPGLMKTLSDRKEAMIAQAKVHVTKDRVEDLNVEELF